MYSASVVGLAGPLKDELATPAASSCSTRTRIPSCTAGHSTFAYPWKAGLALVEYLANSWRDDGSELSF